MYTCRIEATEKCCAMGIIAGFFSNAASYPWTFIPHAFRTTFMIVMWLSRGNCLQIERNKFANVITIEE